MLQLIESTIVREMFYRHVSADRLLIGKKPRPIKFTSIIQQSRYTPMQGLFPSQLCHQWRKCVTSRVLSDRMCHIFVSGLSKWGKQFQG